MKETLRAMGQIFSRSGLKSKSTAKWGLFESRILQAATTSTGVLKFVNDLMNSMAVDSLDSGWVERIAAESYDSGAILQWIRSNHRVAAALACESRKLGDEEFGVIIDSLELRSDDPVDHVFAPPVDYDIPITITLRSPLAHGADKKAGNATLFRRKTVLSQAGTDGSRQDCAARFELPFYAGNAFRGQMRDLLADDFLETLGLKASRENPPIALWFFHTLYAGGALSEGKADKLVTKAIGEKANAFGIAERVNFRHLIPPLALLGCAINKTIFAGRLQVSDFYPRCRETGVGTMPITDMLSWEYLTRRDDLDVEHDESAAMIATSEILVPGTVLTGGVDIDPGARPADISCLHRGLELMQQTARLGAGARMGWGAAHIEYGGYQLESAPYLDELVARREEILTLLRETGALHAGD